MLPPPWVSDVSTLERRIRDAVIVYNSGKFYYHIRYTLALTNYDRWLSLGPIRGYCLWCELRGWLYHETHAETAKRWRMNVLDIGKSV